MTRSLPLAVLTLLFHGVVKLLRELRIESFKNRKLARHAIFVVEAGINQPETIVCLGIVWLNSKNFFQRCQRFLIFPGLVTGVSQSVKGFGVRGVQRSRLVEGIRRLAELSGAKTGRSQTHIRRFVVGTQLRGPSERFNRLRGMT